VTRFVVVAGAVPCATDRGDAHADPPPAIAAGVAPAQCEVHPGDAHADQPPAVAAGVAAARCDAHPGDAHADLPPPCGTIGGWVMRGRSQRVRVPVGPPRRPPTAPRPPTRPTRSL
jgi:hypothetical protein